MWVLEGFEGRTLVPVQWDTVLDAQRQVGLESKKSQDSICYGSKKRTHVSDVMTSKGNQAAQRAGGFLSGLGSISTSSDEHLIAPDLPKELVRLRMVAIAVIKAGDARLDNMKVSEVGEPFSGLRDEVGEGRFGVFHLHSLPSVPGGDTESDSVLANSVRDGLDDFERESGTVLNRSTVFICPLVRDVLKELVWEISVGEVKLDAVESSPVDGFIGGDGMPLDVGLDLLDCQRARGRTGRRHGDGGSANKFETGVFGLEEFNVRAATESPKLEVDIRAISVDRIDNLQDGEVRQTFTSGRKKCVPSSRLRPGHLYKRTERGGMPRRLDE